MDKETNNKEEKGRYINWLTGKSGLQKQSSMESAWKGGSVGVLIASIVVSTVTAVFFRTGLGILSDTIIGILAGGISALVFTGVTFAGILAVRFLPAYFVAALGGAIGAICTAINVGFYWPDEIFYSSLLVYVWVQAILSGALWLLLTGGLRTTSSVRKAVVFALLALTIIVNGAAVFWLYSEGVAPNPLKVSSPPEDHLPHLDAGNPSEPGSHSVRRLSYGSGEDLNRPVFGSEVDIRTEPVDGSLILPEWSDFTADFREWYWGFGIEDWPTNGRVWMPEEEGSFPLVLVVHGNHSMQEYSDPGYAYLGRLLASRGFITVSVDENFINSSWDEGFNNNEIPARAWILLQHLKRWRMWNQDPNSPFHERVDLQNIALVGHSRGGEAAPVAAKFNSLSAFPDNTDKRFDFGFSIQSVVALAPTDYRYERQIELEDVNYLTLWGSYDADERSPFGVRQFQRTSFTEDFDGFKAALLFHRGNHGQFNSIWGSEDFGPPGSWFLNTGPLIDGKEQRQIAKVYISAFMEATLKDRNEYVPIFQNHHVASDWLPRTAMLHRFKSPDFEPVANFEEDIDVNTTSLAGGQVDVERMSMWREQDLPFRGYRTQQNNAAIIEWNRVEDEEKAVPSDSAAEYRVMLPEDGVPFEISEESDLVFSLARMKHDDYERPTTGAESRSGGGMGIEVELVDENGAGVSAPLRQYGTIPPLLHTQYMKMERLSASFGTPWQPTLQTYEIPLGHLIDQNPQFDLESLKMIKFAADRKQSGKIALDNIGFRLD